MLDFDILGPVVPCKVASDLNFTEAHTLQTMLDTRSISARELMSATYDQLEQLNPLVNAVCTLLPREQALEMADASDRARAKGVNDGPLSGIPIAIKDLALTKGIRTTMGSKAFANHIPDQDAVHVERVKAAGALVIGKTNTPEFGAGSHTFNDVFGVTRNPYNVDKTAGGSSGGAAAALAAGMVPLADGSDMGGSLRNPAAFCNVVGFRPSIGMVPSWPTPMIWQSRLGVEGPMARTVRDCALLFSVMSGPDHRDPLSWLQAEVEPASLDRNFRAARIAWSADLNGLQVVPAIRDICGKAVRLFEDLGCHVDAACPDFSDAMQVFRVLRASYFAESVGPLLDEHETQLKATVRANARFGMTLTAGDLTSADVKRTALYYRMCKFFELFDFLLVPTTQVTPFDVSVEWPTQINGQEMTDYIDWMSICCMISVTGLPVASVPCGFTNTGLPVGLQIIGPPGKDWSVLQLAHAFEKTSGYTGVRPPIVCD